MNRSLRGLRIAAVIIFVSFAVAAPARADLVTDWNQQAFNVVGGNVLWTVAMVHLAMFDAFNGIEPRYRPYMTLPAPPDGASPDAAAACAAYGVLVRLAAGRQRR